MSKFRFNLYKKFRGIPPGADLDEEFLQDCSIPITKRNALSVACQFYDSTGLAAPLMFSVRSLFSDLCQDCQCSMNFVLSEIRAAKFCTAVDQILRTSELSFPRQVLYHVSGQLYIFLTAVCKVMVLVFTFAPKTWSTCCTVLQK